MVVQGGLTLGALGGGRCQVGVVVEVEVEVELGVGVRIVRGGRVRVGGGR